MIIGRISEYSFFSVTKEKIELGHQSHLFKPIYRKTSLTLKVQSITKLSKR